MEVKINKFYVGLLSVIVALGGFLLGFDSAVISGAVPYYTKLFGIDQASFWFGFSVSSLTAGSILGNFIGGILADKYGRKIILVCTAILFAFCAIGTGLSHNLSFFIFSRIIGGIGVGMAILVAPMYIAEVAPQRYRGILVSINQLNIVLGISVAFFSNYFINNAITDTSISWRWMLGVGAFPALAYFILLFFVPQSPRWLIQHGRREEARKVLNSIGNTVYVAETLTIIETNIEKDKNRPKAYFKEIFSKNMRTIMLIGLGIAALQQISAINAILYYAPIIFETTGGGRDAAFMEAVIIGVVNLVFTIVAMTMIDSIGRKPLLIIGLTGIILAYSLSAFAFSEARYSLSLQSIDQITLEQSHLGMVPGQLTQVKSGLTKMAGKEYTSEIAFYKAVKENSGLSYSKIKNSALQYGIHMHAMLVLIGILLFIASFAISLGPVTWAMLSEIFPNRIRGLAISIAGTFNALVSATVITIFPAELAKFGTGITFIIFAVLCAFGLLFVIKFVPETKGKSLEEIQEMFEKDNK